MYFQFLIEDASAEILIGHVMGKVQDKYPEKEILFDTKSFTGIGHLRTTGNLMERKGGNLLNNLHIYLRGFDRSLSSMEMQRLLWYWIMINGMLKIQTGFGAGCEGITYVYRSCILYCCKRNGSLALG